MKTTLILLLIFYSLSFARTSVEKIEAAFDRGEISFEQKILYKALSIKGRDHLPEYLKGDIYYEKCATPVIVEIYQNWEKLGTKTRDSIKVLLGRPSLPYTYDSPGGHFKIHYATSGTNGVPNTAYVYNCAEFFEQAWAKEVEQLGYYAPPSDSPRGGDGRYDVYIINMEYYGYCAPEPPGPEPWEDAPSYIAVENDYEGFPGTPEGCLKVTSAHEFFHAVQFAYDYQEEAWYMEISSTWMEDIIWDEVNDYFNYLPEFFKHPEVSLTTENIHMYASCIFNHYLQSRFGIGTIRTIWEHCRNENVIQAINRTLAQNSSSLNTAFQEFTTWNYITNSRDDGKHYRDGKHFPLIYIEANHNQYPVENGTTAHSLSYLSSNYIVFQPERSGHLIIAFDGDDQYNWGATILTRKGLNYETVMVPIEGPGQKGEVMVPNFENYNEVVLIPVLLSANAYGRFSYQAHIADSSLRSPSNLTAQSNLPYVPLTWESGKEPLYYKIYRRNVNSGPYPLLNISYAPAYEDRKVIHNYTYYYVVTGFYPQGESKFEKQVSATPRYPQARRDTIRYDLDPYSFEGRDCEPYFAAVRFSPQEFCTLKSVLVFLNHVFPYNLFVYNSGPADSIPGAIIHSQSGISSDLWNEINLTRPVIFENASDFWLCLQTDNAYYPMGVDNGSNVSHRSFYSYDGRIWQRLKRNFDLRAIVVFTPPTSIAEPNSGSKRPDGYTILSNPDRGRIRIRLKDTRLSRDRSPGLKIYDVAGKLVKTISDRSISSDLMIPLSPGVYFVGYGSEKNNCLRKVVVIQ